MDDPCTVCRRQRAAGLNGDFEHLCDLETATIEAHPKSLAINELGRDEMNVAGLPDVVNRENVRMIEGRGRSRFLPEPAYASLIGDEPQRQHFHGELPAEPDILRQVDLSHTPEPSSSMIR